MKQTSLAKMKIQKYMHVENGGLTFGVAQDENDPPYLYADWCHYGNAGPKIIFPIITVEQCDAMIDMLSEIRKHITDNHSYNVSKPE
jgi:hypothetical protein